MDNLDKVIESILFVAGDGVEYFDIADKLEVSVDEVCKAIDRLKEEHKKNESGIQILTFNKKAQLCSNSNYADFVAQVLNPIKEKALTRAVLETAAIIAYKQPITRLEIEQVRGVNCDYAMNTLLENKLIDVVGRKEAIGKPLLFGTTDEFLKHFGLNSIDDLPDYNELLDRIKVIHNPQNAGLFDFSNIPEDENGNPIDIPDSEDMKLKEMQVQEQMDLPDATNDADEKNEVVEDLLNALLAPDDQKEA